MNINQNTMETPRVTKEVRDKLREPLPKEAISQHPTKKFLSTIKAIYVVERLNDVFGIGQWSIKYDIVEAGEKMIVAKGVLMVPGFGIEIEQFGGNDNPDRGDAFKGACTDCLTKIGSYLEIGIDVFKGLSDHPNTQREQSQSKAEELPWLNKGTKAHARILERIRRGNYTIDGQDLPDDFDSFIVYISGQYRINKEIMKEFEDERDSAFNKAMNTEAIQQEIPQP